MMFYKETEFKDTEIGRIPKEWDLVKLERIAQIIMGQSPPSSSYNSEGIGLPFLQGKMDFGNIYPSPTKYCTKPIKIAEPNDILISVRAPVGDVNIAPYRLSIGRGLAALRFNSKIAYHLYYFYYLQLQKKLLESIASGSTFKAIVKKDLENLEIPMPPLSEQQKIAEILSTVDLAIQKTDEIITKTERLKKGLMQRLLTKGLGHKEFKDTEIGRIPKDWEVVEIKDVAEQRKETVLPKEEDVSTIYVGLEHIDPGAARLSNFGKARDVKSSKFKFYKGDILYGKLNPYLDKAVLADVNGICSTDFIVIKSKKDPSIQNFLVWVLHSRRFVEYATSTMVGTNHPRTSWDSIAKFKFALPTLHERQKIAEILFTIDKKLELEKKEKEKLERIKQGLMDLLLKGIIRART